MSPFDQVRRDQEAIRRIHAANQEARERALLEAIGQRPLDQDEYNDAIARAVAQNSEVPIWEYGFRRAK